MNKKRILLLFVILAALFCFCAQAWADVGNFNDYDSDSGWDSGSGRDWDSNDDDDDDYIIYGGGSIGGGGSGGSDITGFDIIAAFLVLVIIIVISCAASNKKSKIRNTVSKPKTDNINLTDNSQAITQAIIQTDPNFSKDKFIGWSKEVFITLQKAWSERDWERVRPFEKEELYKQHETQIKEYIDRGWINVLERININNAYLYRYERDKEYEYLTVYIQSRMTDYIKDENTGSIIKGSLTEDSYGKYLYTFIRKNGVLTDEANSKNAIVACPHCGAPTSITSAGKCEYCGFIVTTGEYSWVLSDIEGVKIGASIKPGGVFINE